MKISNKIMYGILMILILGSVRPCSANTIVDKSQAIPSLSYWYQSFELTDKSTVTITLEVTSGNDISVYLMTADDYAEWVGGSTVPVYVNEEDILSATIEKTLEEGDYVLVLDNQDSLTSVTVSIKLEAESVTSYLIGIIIVIAVIVGIVFWLRKRKKGKEVEGITNE
ncbi:MAG: hypothetical protein ACTSYA_01780 [Candidatus Kariarchaeaceae archaeon]